MNNCLSIYHTSWITGGPKSNFICDNIPTKAILFFVGCSEVKSTWLITSELANQRAWKVLFTCVVSTNYRYSGCFLLLLWLKIFIIYFVSSVSKHIRVFWRRHSAWSWIGGIHKAWPEVKKWCKRAQESVDQSYYTVPDPFVYEYVSLYYPQAAVVQRMDIAIHWIKHYKLDSVVYLLTFIL